MTGPSDEELEAMVIGGPTLHNDTIHLAEPDPRWPDLFEREATRLRGVLGSVAVQIEHVGSTSVPGLNAKPVIDIVVAVPDSANESDYLPSLEAVGYILRIREPDWCEHRLFKGPDTVINMHVFSVGCPEITTMITFRDHLRRDPADRALYERAKRELAGRRWKYVQHYANAKSDVVAGLRGGTNQAKSCLGADPRRPVIRSSAILTIGDLGPDSAAPLLRRERTRAEVPVCSDRWRRRTVNAEQATRIAMGAFSAGARQIESIHNKGTHVTTINIIGSGNTSAAMCSQLQPTGSELVPAAREASAIERGRRWTGERP